ncbi:MAG: beta-lactamase family protein [Spirosomaceae bacterium]|nr:beta-lactamase family protein [Spirosomataceae bacterium]
MYFTKIILRAIALYAVIFIAILGCQSNAGQTTKFVDEAAVKAKLDSTKKAIKADFKSAKIDEIIKRKVNAENFNGNVLVAQKGVILYQKAFGLAQFQDSTVLTNDSKFQLASLSKTFTSIAVLKLVQEGKLSLTTTVDEVYPDFPYEGVTIHSLLCHRSGLPYYEYLMSDETRKRKWSPTNQEMMQWFAAQSPTPKAYNLPDHFFSYNNTNFAVLAAIVERISTLSFDVYLRREILVPIGMTNTYANTTKSDSININRTSGYERNRLVPRDYYDEITGDKGIYSTTSDLNKWYEALRDGTVVSKELLQEAFTPRSFEHPGLRNYGYGFRLWVDAKQRTDYVYHTGWWKGYNTIMFFDLREDFVIILLTNRLNRTVYHIKDIIDILHNGSKTATVEENILDA